MGQVNNYRVNIKPALMADKIKKHSANMLKQYFIGFLILYFILNWIPELIALYIDFNTLDLLLMFRELDETTKSAFPRIPIVLYVFSLLFNGVLKLGECFYVLTFIRNRKIEYASIFEGFQFYFKALLLYIVQTILIAFWSMFFVIPGVIMALALSQSYYILADDPDKSVLQIIQESKMRMFGNKMQLVKVYIHYLPIMLLSYIPSYVIANTNFVDTGNIGGLMVLLLTELPLFCAFGYLELGKCTFYELLINEGFENFKYNAQDAFRNEMEVL